MFSKWVIPGGGVGYGERTEDAGKREIKEETNLDVNIKKLICVKEIINLPGSYHGIVFFHLGEVLNPEQLKASDDCSEVGFFSLEEIKGMDVLRSVLEVIRESGLGPKE